MASASAVPSSSRHRTPLSVVNSGMKLRDVYAITRSDGLAQWLRRKGLIADFTDEDCVKCNHGKMRLVKDASYSKDKDAPTGGGYKQWIPMDWTGLDCWVKIVDGRPYLHPTHASHMFACLHYG